jgi:hypothetical protein
MAGRTVADSGLRRRQLAQIHIGAAALGWSRDEYEDIMASVCAGVRSAGQLSHEQRSRFAAHIQACQRANGGGAPGAAATAAARKPRPKLPPRQGKLWALWMQLCDKGLADTRTMKALDAWCERQTQVTKMQWCNDAQLDACIEAAKRWLQRGAQ